MPPSMARASVRARISVPLSFAAATAALKRKTLDLIYHGASPHLVEMEAAGV